MAILCRERKWCGHNPTALLYKTKGIISGPDVMGMIQILLLSERDDPFTLINRVDPDRLTTK